MRLRPPEAFCRMKLKSIIRRLMPARPRPWTGDYNTRKNRLIANTLQDADMMARFRTGGRLPEGFGVGIDERAVEYPWVLARLDDDPGLLLDAGSTFSSPQMIATPRLKDRRLIIYTLATDWITLDPRISYVFGDFRDMLLRDASVGTISCISTLEHVGMGQSYKLYNAANHAPDEDLDAYKIALAEFHRVLAKGGQFLLTVPFGRRENHGWLQQFDAPALAAVIAAFPGELTGTTYYRYRKTGWQSASAAECADAEYYNIHARKDFDSDLAAAARAVACLEFRKT